MKIEENNLLVDENVKATRKFLPYLFIDENIFNIGLNPNLNLT